MKDIQTYTNLFSKDEYNVFWIVTYSNYGTFANAVITKEYYFFVYPAVCHIYFILQ